MFSCPPKWQNFGKHVIPYFPQACCSVHPPPPQRQQREVFGAFPAMLSALFHKTSENSYSGTHFTPFLLLGTISASPAHFWKRVITGPVFACVISSLISLLTHIPFASKNLWVCTNCQLHKQKTLLCHMQQISPGYPLHQCNGKSIALYRWRLQCLPFENHISAWLPA